MLSTPAFLTGSRAYGVPNPDSDIDLVILCEDPKLRDLLFAECEQQGGSVRFGKLNLIVCGTQAQYDVWKRSTEEFTSHDEPTPRERAKSVIASRLVDLGQVMEY